MQSKPKECFIKTLHNLPNSYGLVTNNNIVKKLVGEKHQQGRGDNNS